jgi:hypothetical protein
MPPHWPYCKSCRCNRSSGNYIGYPVRKIVIGFRGNGVLVRCPSCAKESITYSKYAYRIALNKLEAGGEEKK